MDNLDKAKRIVARVIEQRQRWGKNAGFAEYSEADVLDALVAIADAGFLEFTGEEHDKIVASNRAKGAAEARATKYKNQLDHANEQIRALTIALEESEDESCQLRRQLEESLEG